jgi:hypothetical protein
MVFSLFFFFLFFFFFCSDAGLFNAAMLPSEEGEEEQGDEFAGVNTLAPRGARGSVRLGRNSARRDSKRNSARGSGAGWENIPLTPTPPPHKPRLPPSNRPEAPDFGGIVALQAFETASILDCIFSFLTPEELARLCGVNRLWHERAEQDVLWQGVFRPEWQQELNPSPGTFKRWYGAMKSARLSWMNPILQQERVKHESFSGRVEIKSAGGMTYLIAMSLNVTTIWNYSSLQLLHEIKRTCAYALGSCVNVEGKIRLIGGDKKGGKWIVWDVESGAEVFSCAAEEGAFSGGWYIVYRNYLVVYRRSTQALRGYTWNYETPNPADIAPPMLVWETVGNFTMPKATEFGLLMTDINHGLTRIDYDDGKTMLLLKERAEDLDPNNFRVKFTMDRSGLLITRRTVAKNAPILVYDHFVFGVSLQKSISMVKGTNFCCLSEDLRQCFGVTDVADGSKMHGTLWQSSNEGSPMDLSMNLTSARSRFLDSAICNDVVAGLFGDMLNPSEFVLWDAITGKELNKLTADVGERPYQILRFTGLTACLVHKDGALTKIRVVGRRAVQEEQSSCTLQ